MKIAVSASGKDIESKISEVFARCPYFIIVRLKDGKIQEIESMENMAANQSGKAGVSAVQSIVEKGVKAVISNNIGPRATDALKQFNVAIYRGQGSVKGALQQFINGQLKELN